GKTTTIRMMLGLLSPSSGSVNILGLPVNHSTREIRPLVGYMSQRFSLYNDLTVLQNLNFYGQAYGLENNQLKTRIAEAIEMSALIGHENTPTKDLSGGWRQRLALSSAILHRPKILFLDEPTAGVDPISRRDFWNLLYDFVAEGITVFITTHYMDEAEHCHRLAFIQHGKTIALGSPEEIKEDVMPGKVLEIETSDAVQTVKILREANQTGKLPFAKVELYGDLVHLTAPDLKKQKTIIKEILKKSDIHLSSMAVIEPSLEDVFIACMQEA
ncbi:MAG: ABC transporter ATP-binding protein, partial [Chloroflexota bacterium]|nr:ABC transporter ATP-binding protein [Chloroflexota bacterium]